MLRSAGGLVALLPLGHRPRHAAAQAATPACQAAAPGETARINGVDLYDEVEGNASELPVVLLHGSIGNREEWHFPPPVLVAAGFQVIRESRGRGRSGWGEAPITDAAMAADVVGLLDHLGIGQTDVIGWSQGGIIDLELAIRYPERLHRAVI